MSTPSKIIIAAGIVLLAASFYVNRERSTMSYVIEGLGLTLGRVETCEKHILAHREEMKRIRARLRVLENPQGETK